MDFTEICNIFVKKTIYIFMKRILGLGNALTDILLQIEQDEILTSLQLPKGSMQLISDNTSRQLASTFSEFSKKMATGGSASNTLSGLAKLGTNAGFVGKVGNDDIGTFFMKDSINNGVTPHLLTSNNPSGHCTVLVSPDGERTMCTFLGAACELIADDLTLEMFKKYDILHIEGYLVLNQPLVRRAVSLAKEAGLQVSIDLASYNVVEANLDFLTEIVSNYVDIVFANEDEARSFTSKEPKEAVIQISNLCDISVVKIGKEGSFIKSGLQTIQIKPYAANCIDTTGAGDLYAAGFLYGLACNYSLEVCGKIGSLVSAKVVEVLGAKMSDDAWTTIHAEIKNIVS
jgi:sugar/nucleoside kinase (ribokinase family)